MGWQPIETAPEDEHVMIWLAASGNHLIAERCEEKWFDDCGLVDENPTHWMPLPAPPAN